MTIQDRETILTLLPIICIQLVAVDVKTEPLPSLGASSIPVDFRNPLTAKEPVVVPRLGTSLMSGTRCGNSSSLLQSHRRKLTPAISAAKDNDKDASPLHNDSLDNEIDTFEQKVGLEPKRTSHWKIENNNLVPTESCDYDTLQSDRVYIIIQDEGSGRVEYKNKTKIRPERYLYTLYYWVGKQASATDAGEAASSALVESLNTRSKIKIQREAEGHESRAFRALFKHDEGGEAALDDVDTNKKRMFMIEGEDKLHLREVKLKLCYTLIEENCFVFVSRRVHTSCGNVASQAHRKAAKELAKIMMEKKGLAVEETAIHKINQIFASKLAPEDEDDLPSFFAAFESKSEENDRNQEIVFTPKEMRRIFSQTRWMGGTEIFNVEITRIYADFAGSIREEFYSSYNQLTMEQLNTNDCYLVDSRSNVGLFVWMGKETEVFVRTTAVLRAELYLREKGYHYATPITLVDEEDLPSDTWVQEMVSLLKPENNEDNMPLPPMQQ